MNVLLLDLLLCNFQIINNHTVFDKKKKNVLQRSNNQLVAFFSRDLSLCFPFCSHFKWFKFLICTYSWSTNFSQLYIICTAATPQPHTSSKLWTARTYATGTQIYPWFNIKRSLYSLLIKIIYYLLKPHVVVTFNCWQIDIGHTAFWRLT